LDAYKKNGFIAMDDEHESVSKTLEYAYDDWCIAQMAEILNKDEDYNYFMERSQSWKNVFDWNTGFMRPKKNGGWEKPFDPKEINNNFTEGNSWQYSFFVPQDIQGMIEAYGGAAKFEAKLDEMFNSESKTTGREQADVTGLIGQYAHGNEPSHHIAYLYNYVDKPEKTNEKAHFILDNFYRNAPDGMIGNEDCGQMSAWYVLSSMGIYTVTPGSAEWTTAKPYFENVKVNFEDGMSEILNVFSNKSRLGIINTKYNFIKPVRPKSIISVPVIQAESNSFKDKMKVEIISQNPNNIIYYYIDDKPFQFVPSNLIQYDKSIEIDKTTKIICVAMNGNKKSNFVRATFYKKPNNYTIEIKSKYNSQYTAGGDEGLIDGISGNENWKKGEWQGYQSQDFEAIIDLKTAKTITEVGANFLQDSPSWILMPTKVEFYTSMDNTTFELVKTIENTFDPKITDTKIINFTSTIDPKTAKFLKVKAYNFGKLPEWHQGFGGDAFIFIDEITIK
jgi:hypothetical protein